ncbi:hypothetical protein D3C75_1119630 [compost metagenome]
MLYSISSIGNRLQALIRNLLAAYYTYSVGTVFHPLQGGFNVRQFLGKGPVNRQIPASLEGFSACVGRMVVCGRKFTG